MKCTNKSKRKKRSKSFLIVCIFLFCVGGGIFLWVNNDVSIYSYESQKHYDVLYQEDLRIDSLCVTTGDVPYDAFKTEDILHASALFQLNDSSVLYSDKIHNKLYPASTTKILTAYLALKYGNLEDTVTVSETAVNVPADSSKANLQVGDKLTLKSLLYALMLPSGNDSAVAIAEHISGSQDTFITLMNEEAKRLGATSSHFVNPHGYHDENHYTTAYDLYLIFNECVKNDTFLEIVSAAEYQTKVIQSNGTYRNAIWKQSNQFVNGTKEVPNGIDIIGGKTGTTDQAGSCLILYSEKSEGNPYISIIMGADSKPILYDNMSNLISTVAK